MAEEGAMLAVAGAGFAFARESADRLPQPASPISRATAIKLEQPGLHRLKYATMVPNQSTSPAACKPGSRRPSPLSQRQGDVAIIASRVALNSQPGFQVGQVSPWATSRPSSKSNRSSGTAPRKSHQGLISSLTLW